MCNFIHDYKVILHFSDELGKKLSSYIWANTISKVKLVSICQGGAATSWWHVKIILTQYTSHLFSSQGGWKETIQEHRHYDALQLPVTIIQLSACLYWNSALSYSGVVVLLCADLWRSMYRRRADKSSCSLRSCKIRSRSVEDFENRPPRFMEASILEHNGIDTNQ